MVMPVYMIILPRQARDKIGSGKTKEKEHKHLQAELCSSLITISLIRRAVRINTFFRAFLYYI